MPYRLKAVRFLFRLLAALLCLLLAGCSNAGFDTLQELYAPAGAPQGQVTDVQLKSEVLRLPYHADDTLNPYTLRTRFNYDISTLLYDPLFRLSPDFEPQPVLAGSVVCEGLLCVVTLQDGVLLDDGAPLTAQDVVYSLNAAAGSERYGAALQNAETAQALSADTVSIRLREPDRLFANLLTFPIVREGTAGQEHPVGRGRCRLAESGLELYPNDAHPQKPNTVRRVELVQPEDDNAASFYLKSGEIHCLYGTPENAAETGVSNSSVPVQLNHLLYLGVNQNRALLAPPQMRRALSLLLERETLVSQGMSARAVAAQSPFYPGLYRPEELPRRERQEQAAALLEGLEIQKDSETDACLYRGAPLTLTLLSPQGGCKADLAGLIAGQLEQAGIGVQVEELPFPQYLERLAAGNYDLYIAEVSLSYNMDISLLLRPGTSVGAGVVEDEALLAHWAAFRAGGEDCAAFAAAFAQSPVFLPLAWRQDAVFYSRDFYAEPVATPQDIFYNINKW